MFQAVLFRKLDESLFAKEAFEDILTSDVFGAFKYLPADYLEAWIARLRDRHPLLAPAFKLMSGFPEVEFWPRLHAAKLTGDICEPDVVFWWQQLAVVIEAKRASDFDLDQLQAERESTQHAAMARGLAAQVVVVAVGRNRPSWWFSKRQATTHWLAFSTWGTLADVFLATLDVRQRAGSRPEEAALVRDLLARLDMRDVRPFRGFRSLASPGAPSSRPLLPRVVRPLAGVFLLRASAPEVRVAQIWPPASRFQRRFVDLARSAATHRGSDLFAREVSPCVSGVPDFCQLSRAVPERAVNAWPLQVGGGLSTRPRILVWEKSPQCGLAMLWRPSLRRGCSIAVRGAPTIDASCLFWTLTRD